MEDGYNGGRRYGRRYNGGRFHGIIIMRRHRERRHNELKKNDKKCTLMGGE